VPALEDKATGATAKEDEDEVDEEERDHSGHKSRAVAMSEIDSESD